MSFIRATSNPEGLYVFDHIGGYVAWWGCGKVWELPRKDFYALARAYARGQNYQRGRFGPLSYKEVWVKAGTHVEHGDCCRRGGRYCAHDMKIKFTFRGMGSVYLWRVTWEYMIRNAIKPWP